MNGAQIGAQDSNEKTPLNLALCELGTLETADVLIQNNAYVTPEDQVAYDKKKETLEKANLITKVNQTIKTADYNITKDSYDLNSSNTVLSSCLKRKLSDVNASNFSETSKSYKSWFKKQSKCEKPSKIVVNKPDECTTQMNRVQQSIYETSLNYYSICDEDANMMMSQYNCTPKNSANPNVFLSSNQLNLSKYEERNSNEPFDRNGQYTNVNYAFQHHLLHYQENKNKSASLTYSQQTSQQNQRNSIGTNLYFNSGSTETYEAYI